MCVVLSRGLWPLLLMGGVIRDSRFMRLHYMPTPLPGYLTFTTYACNSLNCMACSLYHILVSITFIKRSRLTTFPWNALYNTSCMCTFMYIHASAALFRAHIGTFCLHSLNCDFIDDKHVILLSYLALWFFVCNKKVCRGGGLNAMKPPPMTVWTDHKCACYQANR